FSAGCNSAVGGPPYTSMEIGDGVHGNVFDNVHSDNFVGCGVGIKIYGCTSWTSIRGNTWTNGQQGVQLDYPGAGAGYVSIRDNLFKGLANGAVNVLFDGQVAELLSNRFEGNDGLVEACMGFPSIPRGGGAAVWIYDKQTSAPRVLRARDNVFV